MCLDSLKKNKIAVVKKVNADGRILKKLNDFGVVEGARLSIIKKAPFNGAIAVFSRGFIFLIRQKDAKKIEVEYEL